MNERKLINALRQTFPFDLYKQLNPTGNYDPENERQIIEQYIEDGMHTINLRMN